MDLLIFALIAVLVVALLIWLIDMVGLPHPLNMICKAVVAIIAIVLIIQRAGVL